MAFETRSRRYRDLDSLSGFVEIDWGNALTTGLEEFFLPTEQGYVRLVGRQDSPSVSSGIPVMSSHPSEGAVWDNTGDHLAYQVTQPNTGPHSIVCRASAPATNTTKTLAGFGTSASTGPGSLNLILLNTGVFRLGWITTSGGNGSASGGSYSANTVYNVAGSFQAGDIRLYADGKEIATSTSSPSLAAHDLFTLGATISSGSASSVQNKTLCFVAIFDRALSPDEIYSLHESPRQLLRTRHKYWTSASGITAAMAVIESADSASASAVLASTATLSVTEPAQDSFQANASPTAVGVLSATEEIQDSFQANASPTAVGALSATEETPDQASASALCLIHGSASATELDQDTMSATSQVSAQVSVSALDEADSSEVQGSLFNTASLAVEDQYDAVESLASATSAAEVSATEEQDVFSASASIGQEFTAEFSAVEDYDGCSAEAQTIINTAIAAAESGDSAALNGALLSSAACSVTDAHDLLEITAQLAITVTQTSAVEELDIAEFSGLIGDFFTASMAVLEASDSAELQANIIAHCQVQAMEQTDSWESLASCRIDAGFEAYEVADNYLSVAVLKNVAVFSAQDSTYDSALFIATNMGSSGGFISGNINICRAISRGSKWGTLSRGHSWTADR